MRIGIDCRMFKSSFTGIGRYTFELVRNLQRLSQTTPEAQQNEYVLFLNDPEFTSYTPTEPNFKKVLVNAAHYSIQEQTKFLKVLNAENLDLMHFTHFNAPIRYKKPSIVTIHDLAHTLFPGRKMRALPYRLAYKAVIKSAVKKAKRIIAVSKNTKNDLIKILHIPSHRIDVIYEGVNNEFHQLNDDERAQAKTNLTQNYGINQPFLLYTGVHRYHKNLPRLIEAFAILTTNHPDLQLVITGKPDPLYPEAHDLAQHLNLQDKVIFPGLVPEKDLIALYNLAQIYVFPSLYEGFGLPALEAMQCGTPVCASNVSSIPEITGTAKDGTHNAVLFDPLDPRDIATKIESILENPALQSQLIESGLKRVTAFSWEKMAKEILELYNEAALRART